jgi:hypothetical protein
VRTPAQAERWTWLVLAASSQLRLARPVVADQRLAWERPRSPGQLSPSRVRRGVRARCAHSARRPPRRNPPGAPPGHPKATDLVRPAPPGIKQPTIKPSRKARKQPIRAAKAA